jgi:ATP-dependent DNA helicase RecQ
MITAYTATTTKAVKEDIVSVLRLNKAVIVRTGFNRNNLIFID